MIEQPKRLIVFADPGVDYRKPSADLRTIVGVLRFWQQFRRKFAFGDGRVFLPKRCESLTKKCMARSVIRTFVHQLLSINASVLECSRGLQLVTLVMINEALEKCFGHPAGMRI